MYKCCLRLTVIVRASLLGSVYIAFFHPAQAQLVLQTEPQGARVSAAAPNIIISVDNSGSMGATGTKTLQTALLDTFADSTRLPDGRIRLAWQAMNACSGFPGINNGGCKNNGMRAFEGTHRANFKKWVNALKPSGGTPSFRMFINAGEYLKATGLGVDSPWAYQPGFEEKPILSCRKSFHIFLSDGGYGDRSTIGDVDGTFIPLLPDQKTTYIPNTSQTNLYSDDLANTLADVAFHYWATDLQPDIPNDVPESWASYNGQKNYFKDNNENYGSNTAPAILEPFWNPRNNPATWQHMVNYTIGFKGAASWNGAPTWSGESNTGLSKLILREEKWKTGLPDHWHAAINSRGRFIPVKLASELSPAFKEILDEISDRATQAPAAAAGSNLRLGSPGLVFVTRFNAADWSGSVTAYPISTSGQQGATPLWDAAKLLDARTDARRILTVNSTTGLGTTFDWGNLSTTQQSLLKGGDNFGTQRVAYIAGDLSAHGSFRARSSRLGSIVNSVPLYVGAPGSTPNRSAAYLSFIRQNNQRPAVTYVGSGSGKLHAFDAATGRELMAYVPQGLYSKKLRDFTLDGYQHQYMVDGSPFSADADIRSDIRGASQWSTILVGTLGLGGRGYFALNASQPESFATAAPGKLVLFDRSAPGTTGDDADIGHIASPPVLDSQGDSRSEQIVRLNNNRWALLMGNGVNSPNQRPVLLIQYLDGTRELKTLVANTTNKQGNGLGSPRAVDLDGNGTTDLVYAGDQKGQVWRFDLLGADTAKWKVGLKGQPLARGISTQPITAAPYWLPHPLGGLQIAVGTGRHLATSDQSNTVTQTLFGIRDNFKFSLDKGSIQLSESTLITSLNQLVRQSVDSTSDNGFSTTTGHTVNYSQKHGWYLDLPVAGERLLENPSLLKGQLIEFVTVSPNSTPPQSCEKPSYSSGTTFISYLDIINGASPANSLFTPVATDARYLTNRYQTSSLRVIARSLLRRKDIAIDPVNGNDGTTSTTDILSTQKSIRIDWRQLR